jgi:hypothetical protein
MTIQRLLSSNVGRLKAAFAERDKKQTMIDLRGISKTGLKTSYVLPLGFLPIELYKVTQAIHNRY